MMTTNTPEPNDIRLFNLQSMQTLALSPLTMEYDLEDEAIASMDQYGKIIGFLTQRLEQRMRPEFENLSAIIGMVYTCIKEHKLEQLWKVIADGFPEYVAFADEYEGE